MAKIGVFDSNAGLLGKEVGGRLGRCVFVALMQHVGTWRRLPSAGAGNRAAIGKQKADMCD